MNMPLYKREWKSNYKIILIIMAVITLYSSMIIAMFDPKLGASLELMAEGMPELFAAFGMAGVGTTLLDFLVTYLYGFILIVFPMLLAILLANRLIAGYVDKGSMSYLLASPVKRSRLAGTQAVFLISGLLLVMVYTILLGIVVCGALYSGQLDIPAYLKLNMGLFGYVFFTGGVCFFASCLFSDTKYSYGVSSGACILFLLLQMVSQAGERFNWLKYITPITLFQAEGLIAGEAGAIYGMLALYGAGLLLYGLGVAVFSGKDLSI